MKTILTLSQSNFLKQFFQLSQDFYLTGGTALSAFYLKHRYSVDLDLFTQKDQFFQKANDFVEEACIRLKIPCIPVEITSFFKHFRVGSAENPLTLHFSKDYSPHIEPPNRFGEIIVDSLQDIAANKICAALGRTEIKDLVDLYFLDKEGYSIPNSYEMAQRKDGGLSWETLAYTLSQFEITSIPAFMIKPVTVEALQQFLGKTIEWLIRQSAPPAP
ncbi:MAG: nucleotidyl transferase AbiEii/AbiGii toxin family protein [bacterium]